MSDAPKGGRYFGPARFFLAGDRVLAQRHISEARMLLGYMRDQHALGGPAFQVQHLTLTDGTTIRGVMNNGLYQAEVIAGRLLVPIKPVKSLLFLLQPVVDAAMTRPYMVKIPERHVIYDAGIDDFYVIEDLPFGTHYYWWSDTDVCTVYDGQTVSAPSTSFHAFNNEKFTVYRVGATAVYNDALVRMLRPVPGIANNVSVSGAYSGSYSTSFFGTPQFSPDGSQIIGYLNAGGGSGMVYTYVIGTKNPTTSGMTWTRYDIPHVYQYTFQSNPETIVCTAAWAGSLPPDGQVGGTNTCTYTRPYAEDVWFYEQLVGTGFLDTGAPAIVTRYYDERTIDDPFLMVSTQTYVPTAFASWAFSGLGLLYEGYRTYAASFSSDQFQQARKEKIYRFLVNGVVIREYVSERVTTHTDVSSGEREVFNGGAPIIDYSYSGPSIPQPPMPTIPDWSTRTVTDSTSGTEVFAEVLWYDTREHVYLLNDSTYTHTSLSTSVTTGSSTGTTTSTTTSGGLVITSTVRVVTKLGEVVLMSRDHTQYEVSGPTFPVRCAAREGVAVIALIGVEYNRTWVVRYSPEEGLSATEVTSRIPEGWEVSDVTLAAQNERIKRI